MAAGYATIANDGVYIEPTFYKKIVNSNGKTIIESKQKTRKVFSVETSFILKELLKQPVVGQKGTATYCKISGMDVAAKTGTTDENYDRWLCGFTPYYTAVTWYGFDSNETINYNGKKNPAGLLWAAVMKDVHSNLQDTNFAQPSSVVEETVCSETGLVANSGCTNTYTEYYLKGTVPDKCNKHLSTKSTVKK
jgi:penicillin-binding protein 1A